MKDGFQELAAQFPLLAGLSPAALAVLIVVAILAFILKGISLWYAARGGQKVWFIALFLVNTFGILEIIYLIWFRPQSFELEERPVDTSSAGA